MKNRLESINTASKKLVYYTIACDPKYAEAAILSARSLRANSSVGFDLLALCDEKLVPQLSKNGFECRKYPDTDSQFEAATRRLTVLDDDTVRGYEKVMYVDVDIIADVDIAEYFVEPVQPDTLYVCREGGIDNFKNSFWGIEGNFFDDQQLAELESKNIYPFNTGFFFFRPSQKMAHHFNEVLKIARKHSGSGSASRDQGAFNHYFPIHGTLDQQVINDTNYELVYVQPGEPSRQKGKLVHFCGTGINIEHKLCKMYRYVESYLAIEYDVFRPRRYKLNKGISVNRRAKDNNLLGTQGGAIQLNDSALTIVELLTDGWQVSQIVDEIAELTNTGHPQIADEVETVILTLINCGAIKRI